MLFILQDVKVPASLQLHYLFEHFPDATLSAGAGGDVVGRFTGIVRSVRGADAASACPHDFDIGHIVSEIHDLCGVEAITPAEILEIRQLVTGAEINVLRGDAAAGEPLGDAAGSIPTRIRRSGSSLYSKYFC